MLSRRHEITSAGERALPRTLGPAHAARAFHHLQPEPVGQVMILAQYAPGTTQGYARVTRIDGSDDFIGYGVINDGGRPGERTGDGTFISSSP